MFLLFILLFKSDSSEILLNKDTVKHQIDVNSMQYHYYLKKERSDLIIIKPTEYIKLSLKIGTNKSFFSDLQSSLVSEGLNDFADVAMPNIVGKIGYDFRIKYKINNKLNIMSRYQSNGDFKATYLGLSIKI